MTVWPLTPNDTPLEFENTTVPTPTVKFNLAQLNQNSATVGQGIRWNGTAWEAAANVQAVVHIWSAGTEATCNSTTRGYVVMVQGGAGVADTLRICRKDADRMFPQADEASIDLGSEGERLAREILEAKKTITKASADQEEAEKKLKTMLRTANRGTAGNLEIKWPMRNYAATPQKIVPAKAAYSVRQSTLSVKEMK